MEGLKLEFYTLLPPSILIKLENYGTFLGAFMMHLERM
jgi:hypothetical protein